ncbi:MAG: hypothetical protein PHF86_08300 [Candidatus Nanoarchaeia archaeon]|nr:hypothetical protein [Candidatus Nanoarchaeia archaeon]
MQKNYPPSAFAKDLIEMLTRYDWRLIPFVTNYLIDPNKEEFDEGEQKPIYGLHQNRDGKNIIYIDDLQPFETRRIVAIHEALHAINVINGRFDDDLLVEPKAKELFKKLYGFKCRY